MLGVSSILRNVQTCFPSLRPLKFQAYNTMTKYLGWHIEGEFNLLSRMPRIDLAIDIGGNWGQSILALKARGRPKKVVSFEPNPILAARLQRVFADDNGVDIKACGLGDQNGEFALYIPRYRNFEYDGLASLDEAEARNWLPGRMAWFDPAKLHIDQYVVSICTLDAYGFVPDVVKIDTQGLETQVVRGGLETFRNHRPFTIVETPTAELTDLFKTFGMDAYRWTGTYLVPGDYAGPIKGFNTLFLSQDRLAEMGLAGLARADQGRVLT